MIETIRFQVARLFWAVGDVFYPTPPTVRELENRTALRPGETFGDYVGRLNDGRVG